MSEFELAHLASRSSSQQHYKQRPTLKDPGLWCTLETCGTGSVRPVESGQLLFRLVTKVGKRYTTKKVTHTRILDILSRVQSMSSHTQYSSVDPGPAANEVDHILLVVMLN